jgi:high frequency lysogenization protein
MPMSKTLEDRTIALAALFQATAAVADIATAGETRVNITCLVQSLFNINPKDTVSIYASESVSGNQNLRCGLDKLIQNLSSSRDQSVIYAISLLGLQKKLLKNDALLQIMSEGIKTTASRLDHFDLLHDNIFASLGDLYSQTVSKLSPRIIVKGEEQFLRSERHANKIRTLLLCGIRAGILWHQCGGSKWELLFSSKKIVNCAQYLKLNSSDN